MSLCLCLDGTPSVSHGSLESRPIPPHSRIKGWDLQNPSVVGGFTGRLCASLSHVFEALPYSRRGLRRAKSDEGSNCSDGCNASKCLYPPLLPGGGTVLERLRMEGFSCMGVLKNLTPQPAGCNVQPSSTPQRKSWRPRHCSGGQPSPSTTRSNRPQGTEP